MSALGGDVKSAVEVLLSTYETAQVAVGELREAMLPEAEAPGDSEAAARHLFERQEVQRRAVSAFKSVFIFVRAYQDAVCGFLLALERKPVGKYVSMAKHLKKRDGSVSMLLDEKFPSYREWFGQWKEDRDAIKAGAFFALHFDGDDNLSLSFIHPQEQGERTEERRIELQTVVEGLETSARLTAIAFGQAGELYYIDWPPRSST
jgi:hypothetical protein